MDLPHVPSFLIQMCFVGWRPGRPHRCLGYTLHWRIQCSKLVSPGPSQNVREVAHSWFEISPSGSVWGSIGHVWFRSTRMATLNKRALMECFSFLSVLISAAAAPSHGIRNHVTHWRVMKGHVSKVVSVLSSRADHPSSLSRTLLRSSC